MLKNLISRVSQLVSNKKSARHYGSFANGERQSAYADEEYDEDYAGSLRAMPAEIIQHILSFLSVQDLCAMCVSHAFKTIALDMALWRRFFVRVATQHPPRARVCHSFVVHKERMYIYGGHVPDAENCIRDVKNDLHSIQLGSKKWEQSTFKINRSPADTTPSPTMPFKTEHTAVVYNNKMFLFGGYSGTLGYRDSSIYEFDFDRKQCTKLEVTGTIPPDRSAHVAVVYGKHMYVFGGWDGTESKNDFFKFDFDRKSWSQVAYSSKNRVIPPRLRSHCCAVMGDSMVIFGGFGEGRHLNNIYSFSFIDSTWTHIPSQDGPCGRSRSRMAYHGGSLWCFGGWNGKTYFNDLWRFKMNTQTWHLETAALAKEGGLGQHSLCVHQERLVLFGGYCPVERVPLNGLFIHKLPSAQEA